MASIVCARWLPPFWCTFIALHRPLARWLCDVRWRAWDCFHSLFRAITLLCLLSYAHLQHMHKCTLLQLSLSCHNWSILFYFGYYSVYLFPVFEHFLRFYFCHVDYYLMQLRPNCFIPSEHKKMHFSTLAYSCDRWMLFSEIKRETKINV